MQVNSLMKEGPMHLPLLLSALDAVSGTFSSSLCVLSNLAYQPWMSYFGELCLPIQTQIDSVVNISHMYAKSHVFPNISSVKVTLCSINFPLCFVSYYWFSVVHIAKERFKSTEVCVIPWEGTMDSCPGKIYTLVTHSFHAVTSLVFLVAHFWV